VSARTLTGVRSVDLDHLTGVRLGVTSTAGRRVLRRAIKRQTADGTGRSPRVSRAASAHLGNESRRQLFVHTVLVFLAEAGFVAVHMSALFALGDV